MFTKVPATLAFSVNVFVELKYPLLVALNVIVGVAFFIAQLIVFVPVELSLHLYPLDNVAVTF